MKIFIKKITFIAGLFVACFAGAQDASTATGQGKLAQQKFNAYLFVYFTGNDKDEESIRFAISKDGYTFRALNNNQACIVFAKNKFNRRRSRSAYFTWRRRQNLLHGSNRYGFGKRLELKQGNGFA